MAAWRHVLAVAAAVLGLAASAAAQNASFFKGRTVTLLIGFGPGGANDAWARTLARHMPRHWPGNPAMVVQYQPGAGGLTLLNQLAAVSPRDSTVMGLVSRGIALEPLLGGQGVAFDPRKLGWIGSPEKDTTVCVARKDTGITSREDLYTHELVVGASGSGGDSAIYPEFLSALLGMRFKVVKGYKGSNEMVLAMERGEVQGLCVAHDSISRQPIAREGRINVLFQATLVPDPRLPDVPVGIELARNEDERQALQLFFARVALGRPFLVPPGLPPDRLAMIRTAFAYTMADREFVEEVGRQGLTIAYVSGEEIATMIDAAYRTPPSIVARTIKALGR